MILKFHLKGSADILQVWKGEGSNIYWSRVIGVPSSIRFHKDIDVLVEYLCEVINSEPTKRNLKEAIESIL